MYQCPIDSKLLGECRSIAFVVLDSLRWDSYVQARTDFFDGFQVLTEHAYSYAPWTLPSHSCILAGLLPHYSEAKVLAHEVYQRDHFVWDAVLKRDGGFFKGYWPEMRLALAFQRAGWETRGCVSMPVIGPTSTFGLGFDHYTLRPQAGTFLAQIEEVTYMLPKEKVFLFLNVGETHYPYLLPKEKMPKISGLHGVAKHGMKSTELERAVLSKDAMALMQQSQREAVELIDSQFEAFLKKLPVPTLTVVISDHGELFGEEDFFGHGPFVHPKLHEVPSIMFVYDK